MAAHTDGWDDTTRRTLAATADRIIPADDWPSASEAGVVGYLQGHAGGRHLAQWEVLGPGLAALAASGFADLDAAGQDELLGRAEQDQPAFFSTLVALVAEGYYAGSPSSSPPPGWAMVGFTARPVDAPPAPPAELEPPSWALNDLDAHYDVIVVGAGAGGGAAAASIARAGRHTLLVERGNWLPFSRVGRDHVSNHRLGLYGQNTGPEPEGFPRTFLDDGPETATRPHDSDYHNNAMTYGGGTRVFGAQAWRFHPDDFAMATRYGVPAGSSLADWPISYADLEPYYDRAEWEIGVSGEHPGHPDAGLRRRPYPMPALPLDGEARLLGTAAQTLGWPTAAVPLLINGRPWGGRPACERCGCCVGFACPVNAKNGPYNTVLPSVLASGACHLVLDAMVERLTADAAGRVTGVSIVTGTAADVQRRVITADHVVVAAGAIESARLLLNSPTAREPGGIGNGHDQVGRHLQGHAYSGAFGLFAEPVRSGLGPGPSVATRHFSHGNEGVIGGGMLANEFVKLPYHYWVQSRPPGAPSWGLEGKRVVRDGYHRTSHIMGPTEDIPNPDARVRLSPAVKDRYGVPVAMLSGGLHPETLRTAAFMRERAVEWLRAAGASQVWAHAAGPGLSAGQHQAGTLRMGADPTTSVTDPTGRVHGHANVWVADGSLHVTNGGVNPVLTILALAFRTADGVVEAGF